MTVHYHAASSALYFLVTRLSLSLQLHRWLTAPCCLHGDSTSSAPFRCFDAPFTDHIGPIARILAIAALHIGRVLLVRDSELDSVVRCDDIAHELPLRVERAVISA